jgi:hypothetical protein
MKGFLPFCILLTTLLTACQQEPPLFVQLPAHQTGITFVNQIEEDEKYNVLDYMNIYTGAGVAAGDINNDGLTDLYFSGNMRSGSLYLNRGNLTFDDITVSAGVEDNKWATGVSMVDINHDGWLDIYVCVSGPDPGEQRANLLYVNQQDNTFKEQAAAYGIAEMRQTMHSAFFDYDKDGDLDLFLIVNPTDSVFNVDVIRPRKLNGQSASTDILYRNDGIGPQGHPTFTDISQEAGILIEGHSLGVAISDINQDSWPDIYISNDFIGNDILYINQQDGTFTDQSTQYLRHTSYAGMGNDVADFNNDGLPDILVLDMRPEDSYRQKMLLPASRYDRFQLAVSKGYAPQFTRNTLQLNRGNGHFSEIGFLSGISSTDWSWSGLMADYDNDGDRDLFVTNGFLRDLGNLDYINYQQVYNNGMGDPEAKKAKKLEDIKALESVPLLDYLFENQGELSFEDRSETWGIKEKGFSSGALYADLDNDGDLELVINTLNDEAHVYENRSRQLKSHHFLKIKLSGSPTNPLGIGAAIKLYSGDSLQFYEHYLSRGYESGVDPNIHFGLGGQLTIDSLLIRWPDDKVQLLRNIKTDQTLHLYYQEADTTVNRYRQASAKLFIKQTIQGLEKHQENNHVDFKDQHLLPHMHSRSGPGIAVGDVNGDGLEDFYTGGAAGQCGQLLIQQQNGDFLHKDWNFDCQAEDTGLLFFDADNDQDLDLYVVSGGTAFPKGSPLYQDRLYLNDGNANFTKATAALPAITASGSVVSAADFDRDGDLDLFVGGRVIPGRYPLNPQSYLLRNDTQDGICRFTDITAEANGLAEVGMVSDALWTDYEGDGWVDLMLVGEFIPLTVYHNEAGNLVDRTANSGLANTHGWWNSLAAADFDHDGDTDYLAGNLGLNARYRASPDEPLCIYASDFDKNGSLDPVMCYYIQGENHLVHSRDDMVKQINAIRSRFQKYEDYAQVRFDEAFLPEELSEAFVVTAYHFASSYVENLGNGQFKLSPLPIEAQFAPVYGMQIDDMDGDGLLDALLVGNSYATEVSSGQYDASQGLLLKGDGKGNFTASSLISEGLVAASDARALVKLNSLSYPLYLISNNDGLIEAYHHLQQQNCYLPGPYDASVQMKRKDGSYTKHEFYYGSGYLSQSSRAVAIPPDVTEIKIIRYNGSTAENPIRLQVLK